MIFAHIRDIGLYRGLGANLSQALDILGGNGLEKQPEGRYAVSGQLYYTVQDYVTKPFKDTVWESHREFIDIQYVAEGVERIAVRSCHDLGVISPYDRTRDIVLYEGSAGDRITLSKGMLAVFFPADAHRPCIAAGRPSMVKKIVIKAAVD
jgi:biofilm protein TabA